MFSIIFGDISEFKADAIVNPTDQYYSGLGGADRCIHRKAGKELRAATEKLPPLETGTVQATPAFGLNAKYIFHTTGPVWDGGHSNEEALLRSSYISSLFEAERRGCSSIAFPLISSGTFGFPAGLAMETAASAIKDFTRLSSIDVTLVLHTKLKEAPFIAKFGEYVMDYYERKADGECSACIDIKKKLQTTVERFDVMLCRLQGDRKGADIYKPALIEKANYSKLKSGLTKNPTKGTVLALAMGLKLDKGTAVSFLESAGYAFSRASVRDLYILHLIENGEYSVVKANIALDGMGLDPLP